MHWKGKKERKWSQNREKGRDEGLKSCVEEEEEGGR